jgi:hypothetical protein
MKSATAWFAVVFAIGAPVGAVLIVLSWLLLPGLVDPGVAAGWRELALAAHILAPVWAPLIVGAPIVSLAIRFGWVDRTSV